MFSNEQIRSPTRINHELLLNASQEHSNRWINAIYHLLALVQSIIPNRLALLIRATMFNQGFPNTLALTLF